MGAKVHASSGIVDNIAEDEYDAFAQIRCFLSYLPGNVWQRAPRVDSSDPPGRIEEELLSNRAKGLECAVRYAAHH